MPWKAQGEAVNWEESLKSAPQYGLQWWAPARDALICRHVGKPGAVIELETDQERERATRVFLSLGELTK